MISISFCICAAGATGVVGESAAGAEARRASASAVALDLLVEVSPERDLRADHRPGRRADDQVGVAAAARPAPRTRRRAPTATRSRPGRHHSTPLHASFHLHHASRHCAAGANGSGTGIPFRRERPMSGYLRRGRSPLAYRSSTDTVADAGCVGRRRLKKRDEREHRQQRERRPQPVQPRGFVLVDDRRRRLRRHARIVERGLEVGVGDERHTARQLGLRLGRQVGRYAGFPAMPVKNELVRAAMSTAPASAVPIDAPRFVMVF